MVSSDTGLQDHVHHDVVCGNQAVRGVKGLQLDIEVRGTGEAGGAVRTSQETLEECERIVLGILRPIRRALVVRDENETRSRVAPLEAGLSGGLRRRLGLERKGAIIRAETGIDIVEKLE